MRDAAERNDVREAVRARYASAAVAVEAAGPCCEAGCGCGSDGDHVGTGEGFGRTLYDEAARSEVPERAALASLGCGNPTAVAELRPGEVVLDLGSGGGLDVLLSARRVGSGGFAYGVDMTREMLDLARRNAADSGLDNVAFLEGEIEDLPLEDASVDVVISNCVINLSSDKPAVFSEMARVLRLGGRIGVTDVVADDGLSVEERRERGSWVGCIAGALSVGEYRAGLEDAGFESIEIVPTHEVADGLSSAIIRAQRRS